MSEKQFNNPLSLDFATEFFGKKGDEFGKFKTGFLGIHNLFHVQDQKPSGTVGGGFTAGSWQTRTLNTILTNTIPLSMPVSNRVLLPAGSYYFQGVCPYYNAGSNCPGYLQARIYSITGMQTLGLSQSAYECGSTTAYGTCYSLLSGAFTLSVSDSIELQHRCSLTNATNGFGSCANFGTEVYADLKLWKLA